MTTAYLGSIEYYRKLLRGSAGAIDLSAPFSRKAGVNRCYIDSPNGPLALTVPVQAVRGVVPVFDVLISEHGNWRHQHWNALASSYRQTPYFDYYEDDFRPFYTNKDWEKLTDFNAALHSKILELIGCEQLVPLHARRDDEYYQVFAHKHGFLPGLSIVDLLFNMGPESVYWL